MEFGVLEGFYGPPWSWDDRVAVMERCIAAGYPWYVWAPKDDPLHRADWRLPFPDAHLAGFRRLASVPGLRLGVGISPGLSIDTSDPSDRAALADKAVAAVDAGAELVMLALDDIPAGPDAGAEHGELAGWLAARLPAAVRLVVVPTDYTGTTRTPYLAGLDAALPPDALVAWTGRQVINPTIDGDDARRFAEAVGGRRLALWDNHPVNDAIMRDRLFLAPASGRDPALSDHCDLFLANAAVQPRCTAVAVVGDELAAEWGLGALVECCHPQRAYERVRSALAAGDLAGLREWLTAVAALQVADDIADEVAPWVAQARAEAALGLAALDLIEAEPGAGHGLRPLFRILGTWPRVRRAEVTVMGPRHALTAELAFSADGSWSLGEGALVEDRNAIDLLCRAALARHRPAG